VIHPGRTSEELQGLVGRALVDPTFRTGLLNGRRAECLSEAHLTEEALAVAASAEATDLASFARQLDRWIDGRAGEGRAVPSGGLGLREPLLMLTL